MKKIAITAVITAALCFGVTSAIGFASPAAHTSSNVVLRPGDSVTMSAIGWGCGYETGNGQTSLTCTPTSKTKTFPSITVTKSGMSVLVDRTPSIRRFSKTGAFYWFAKSH